MNILIAEDHPLYVIGIEMMLVKILPKVVIYKAADFKKALKMLDMYEFSLIILDIVIPYGDKVGMVEAIRLKQPKVRILMCSAYEENLYALTYLKAGANGYISKAALMDDFKVAIEQIMSGKIYASPEVLNGMLGMLLKGKNEYTSPADKLSEKEMEIARLLSKGHSTKQIGEYIHLSSSSVSNYKTKIFQKLGVDNVIQLIAALDIK